MPTRGRAMTAIRRVASQYWGILSNPARRTPHASPEEGSRMCHILRRLVFVAVVCLAVPGIAYAQSAIAGVVRDTSGAVLPGVTVEASSPALIEKVRSVVTDAEGQYKIIDLRPGTYTVTFALPGFSMVKREGIELAASFTATV